MEYVWSLWSLYCDWIKNLTPSGLFVLEANLRWVLNMLNPFAQTQVIAFGWRWTSIYIYIYTHVLIWYYITISLFTLHDCIHNHTHTLLRYVFLYMHILNYFPPYQLLLSPPSEVKLFNSSGSSRTRSTQVGQLSHWTMGMGGKGEVCGSAHSLFGDTIFRCCFGVELIQNIRQLFDTECGLKHCSI